MTKTIGLLVLAFGTPRSFDEIEDYYTRIRHGKKPTPELLEELTDRFKMIGLSPLNHHTENAAAEIYTQLSKAQPDTEFKLYIGCQNTAPFIEDVVKQMLEDGITETIAVAMAPHYSRFSVEAYHKIAHEAAPEMKFIDVKEWWKQTGFTDFWVENINKEFALIPENEKADTLVMLSAHSLPQSLMKMENTYELQVNESADRILAKVDVEHTAKAWQSEGKGASPEFPWLGPDVQDLTRQLYAEKGYKHIIYCPFGFVAEHLEVFYDNDYECKIICDELGIGYHRPIMPNDNPLYISSIVDAIVEKL